MKPLFVLALAAALAGSAYAQVNLQRMTPAPGVRLPSSRDVRLQAARDARLVETPEACIEHNRFLRSKTLPDLRAQLAQLQGLVADRRRHTFMCTGDSESTSADGAVTNCGTFKCNPLDGLCRTKAKTSFDCAAGYLWVASGACVKS